MATLVAELCRRTMDGEQIVIVLSKILIGTWGMTTFLMESCRFHCQCRLRPDMINVSDETLSGERQPRIDKLILVRELPAIHGAAVCAGA